MSGTEHEPGTVPAARLAVVDAMREVVRADRPRVAGWLNSWHPVDETGHVGSAFAVGPHPGHDLYSDIAGALAAVAVLTAPGPTAFDAIGVDAIFTPALQRLLGVAERFARDSGATAVDVAHIEIALDQRRTEGDT
ncbi:hypothetical protein ACWF9G_06695 [Nocardia sp. NPDC055029]